jgi:hypothetical protein
MSIYRIILKLAGRHLVYHLVIPLIAGFTVELVVYRFVSGGEFPDWESVVAYIFSKEHLGLYGGVIATYLLIAGYRLRKETMLQMGKGQIATLTDSLKDAQSFFATSTIRLREWFDPDVQEYFSHIVECQLRLGGFQHERVLLFFTKGDVTDAREKYLDGHYAKPLAEIHKNLGINLAFLQRRDIQEILDSLSFGDKKALGCYPPWISWWVSGAEWWLRRRRRIRSLDFAFVRKETGATVFPFSKRGALLTLKKCDGTTNVEPYERFMLAIRERIYEMGPAGLRLKAEYDLIRELN